MSRDFRHRIVSVTVLCGAALSYPAQAITISIAKIDKGAVQVKGKSAASLALLTWEGQPVAQATKSGAFRFATSMLPTDCVGELSDGTALVPVVISSCGPTGVVQGPPGPKGDTGSAGPPGPPGSTGPPGIGVVVKDATGVVVGVAADWNTGSYGACSCSENQFSVLVLRSSPGGNTGFVLLQSQGLFLQGQSVYFASNDCTGTPLGVESFPDPSGLVAPLAYVGGRLYYTSSALQSRQIGSFLFNDPGCGANPSGTPGPGGSCCGISNGLVSNSAPILEVEEIGPLTPPFRVVVEGLP